MKKLFSFGMALLAALSLNATDYYFAGDASGWSEKNESFKFVEESGVLTLHVADLYGEFKIVENASWHPQHGGVYEGEVAKVELNKPYTLTKELDDKGDPKNVAFDLAENYRYKDATLTLNVTNPDALVITLVSGTLYDHSGTPTTYQIVGGFTDNWNLTAAIQFEADGDVLTAVVPDLNGTFKVVEDRAWDNQYATNWDTKASLEFNKPYVMGAKKDGKDPDNLSLANPFGGYKNAKLTLTEDENGNKVLTLIAGELYKSEADWYLPSTQLGWNCNDETKFTPVEGKENTFELLAAEFSGDFKVVYGNWAVEFGQDADSTKWEVNKEYTLQLKGGNVNAVDNKAVFTDATITIVVDYENVSVKLLIDATPAAVENIEANKKAAATKVIENGQLFIIKEGVRYNALGTVVAE